MPANLIALAFHTCIIAYFRREKKENKNIGITRCTDRQQSPYFRVCMPSVTNDALNVIHLQQVSDPGTMILFQQSL